MGKGFLIYPGRKRRKKWALETNLFNCFLVRLHKPKIRMKLKKWTGWFF